MNKILISRIKNYGEWCCGTQLINDFICGDFFGKTQKLICDNCLKKLTIRKAKIKSLEDDLTKLKNNKHISETALFVGYHRMENSLKEKISEEYKNGNY